MTDRSSLHINKIVPFTVWLRKKMWEIVPIKGDYEIFRAKRGNETLIVYARASAKQHVSLFGVAEKHFWNWKNDRRKYRDSPIRMNRNDPFCVECYGYGDGEGSPRCRNCRCYVKWSGDYDRDLIAMRRLEKNDE